MPSYPEEYILLASVPAAPWVEMAGQMPEGDFNPDDLPDHVKAMNQVKFDVMDELTASGELIASGGFEDPTKTTTVVNVDGEIARSEGDPGADDALVCYMIVRCSRERAVELAGRVAEVTGERYEVRPTRGVYLAP